MSSKDGSSGMDGGDKSQEKQPHKRTKGVSFAQEVISKTIVMGRRFSLKKNMVYS